MLHFRLTYTTRRENTMSHPRKTPSLSSSSSSSSSSDMKVSASSSPFSATKVGPYFFRQGFPVKLLRDSQDKDNNIFKFLDKRSKAKLARTSTLFTRMPEYREQLRE